MTSLSDVHPERAPRSRWRRGALACLFAAGATLAPQRASAEELVELRWVSPPGCPQVDAVRERLRGIVQRATRAAPPLRAEGRIAKIDGKYRLTLLVHDGEARRERIIESDSCAALGGAAAVALGLLLRNAPSEADSTSPAATDGAEPARADSASANETASKATGGTANTAQVRRERSPSENDAPAGRRQRASRELRFVLRAPLGAVDAGLLPQAALTLGGGVGLRYGAWHAGASVRFSGTEELGASNPSDVGVSVQRIATDLWGCGTWSSGRFELGPCLTLAVDRFSARGTGPRVAETARHFVALAPGAGVQAHVRATDWFACFVIAQAGIETSRARLSIDGGVGEVEQLGAVRITAGLGTEWIF